ncbi:MAG: hypothetical protein QOG43_2523 [Actinomycetota bacterium]|nr:hypothetical protein [Actinomycetota bacterium]
MQILGKTEGRGGILGALAVSFVIVIVNVVVVGQGPARAASPPRLSNQVSSAQASAGDQIFDTATLGYGSNPTGYLVFKLFGPDNATCAGNPVLTTTTTVNGNGYYESSRSTVGIAGTYRWIAVYGGDANNPPSSPTACADPAAQVVVSKRVPALDAAPSPGYGNGDSATLSLGAIPSGTVTFKMYGPDDRTCAGVPIFTTTRTVAGNGSFTTGPTPPVPMGTYRWVVGYSGDANNVARSTSCSDSNAFTTSTTKVWATPTTVPRGSILTVAWSGIVSTTSGDWVGVYQVGTADGGAVAAWKYTSGTAAGSLPVKLPWSAPAGQYEVRLMTGNTSHRLATSGPITLVW